MSYDLNNFVVETKTVSNGVHFVEIDAVTIRQQNWGESMSITFKVLDGIDAGKTVDNFLCMIHPNKLAMDIARQNAVKILVATGLATLDPKTKKISTEIRCADDYQQLIEKRLKITVESQEMPKDDDFSDKAAKLRHQIGQYGAKAIVKKYEKHTELDVQNYLKFLENKEKELQESDSVESNDDIPF